MAPEIKFVYQDVPKELQDKGYHGAEMSVWKNSKLLLSEKHGSRLRTFRNRQEMAKHMIEFIKKEFEI